MTSKKNSVLKIFIAVAIVLAALAVMAALFSSREAPKRAEPENNGVLVRVAALERQDINAMVEGTGTVRAAREISIISQVSGEVTMTSPDFVEGGFFKKGQVLFRIDDKDYRLALKQAEAAEARAEYELEQIKSRAGIAKREWEIISGTSGALPPGDATLSNSSAASPNPLVLFGPQLKNARSALESASAQVELARLNLERTVERAPFDCRVRQKNIDTGQYVRAGTQVGQLAGTASAEVMIPLEREELGWISIPGLNSRGKGSEAVVTIPGDSAEASWKGRVVRSAGEVDVKSRTVQVVVAVDDPYGLRERGSTRTPLLSGSFVNVTVKGRRLENVYTIPRHTLRDNSTVWLMGDDGRMMIAKVEVLRKEGDKVIIRDGIGDGQRLIVTRVSGAAEGLLLRNMDSEVAEAPMANSPSADENSTSVQFTVEPDAAGAAQAAPGSPEKP